MGESMETGLSGRSKAFLTVIAILVLIILVLYIWKGVAVGRVEERLEAQKAESTERLRDALALQTQETLRLSAVPLGWAVRTALLKDNFEQADNYMQRLVKEPHVTRIVLVGQDGNVTLATDKKLEGQAASGLFSAGALRVSEATVLDEGEGEILLAIPVVSYDARLGTLILGYSRDSIESKVTAAVEPAEEEPEEEPAEE
jgi:hypothetical protein